MSDIKPKRPARASATSDIALGEPMPTVTTPIVAPEPAPMTAPPAIDVAPVVAALAPSATSLERVEAASVDAWSVFAEAQAALARGFEQAAIEMTGMSRSGLTAASNAAIALLGARTLAEAVEINAGLARRGVDTIIEGSAKLSEIGVKAVAEASQPVFSRLGSR